MEAKGVCGEGGRGIPKSITFFLTTGTTPLQTKSAIYFLTLSNNHISECEKIHTVVFYEFYHDDYKIFFSYVNIFLHDSLENFYQERLKPNWTWGFHSSCQI